MAVSASILASACLCGVPCRYDGRDCAHPFLRELYARGLAVPVCPEVLGGLPIPRMASEIRCGGVVNRLGDDVTASFLLGAEETLKMAVDGGHSLAVLKDKSPSCGSRRIYDGAFSGRLISGMGITAKKLMDHGIIVVTEYEFAGEAPA